MNLTAGKLEWFGGNEDALNMYRTIVNLGHAWDDLVDNDKQVSEARINMAFLSALVYLPANPFYRSIQDAILPMWMTVVSAYETANHFERVGEDHGLEIAHSLRYAVGHIVAYAMIVCIGREEAQKFLPDMWKAVVAERFAQYQQEHQHA